MKPVVAILMGSDSDAESLKGCGEVLRQFGISYVARVLSAHRTPDDTVDFVKKSTQEGVKVFICAAGGAAHLAGVVAANTSVPVIGIPIETSSLNGLDSLLSTVQMPAGTPVGTVAIGATGARNAGFYAARILGLSDSAIEKALQKYKEDNRQKVLAKKVEI
jgi:phosphoribosylaminoimidazole carboxylase PurE protein